MTEAQRLEDLTTDLLDFVRTGPLDLAPVGVEDFLMGVVSEAAEGAVRLDITEAPERWTLDAQKIRQVLVNLLQQRRGCVSGRDPHRLGRYDGRSIPHHHLPRLGRRHFGGESGPDFRAILHHPDQRNRPGPGRGPAHRRTPRRNPDRSVHS